jgi:hypothetical protein
MYVLFIGDVVLIEMVDVHALLAVTGAKKLQEGSLKLIRVVLYVLPDILSHSLHVADVRFRFDMA